jgi:hypothetical protein
MLKFFRDRIEIPNVNPELPRHSQADYQAVVDTAGLIYGKDCPCPQCQRTVQFLDMIAPLNKTQQDYFLKIYATLERFELSSRFGAAVIEGRFSNADEIIAWRRKSTAACTERRSRT